MTTPRPRGRPKGSTKPDAFERRTIWLHPDTLAGMRASPLTPNELVAAGLDATLTAPSTSPD